MKRLVLLLLSIILVFCLGGTAAAADDTIEKGAEAIALHVRSSLSTQEKPAEKLPILMYHEVGEGDSGLYLSPEDFRAHLEYFRDEGYTTLTMSQVYDCWSRGETLPERSVALTFDDGYRSMYETVFPQLQEFEMTATFYVIPAAFWSPWSVDAEMVKEMSDGGMEIGSHTYNHLQLSLLKEEDMIFELTESKAALEKLLGREVISLCYPVGYHNEKVDKAAADCGYKTAVTTKYGLASPDQGMLSLERIRINRGDGKQMLEYKLQGKLGMI